MARNPSTPKATEASQPTGKKIIVRQSRGIPGRDQRTRRTLQALGLGKIGKEKVHTVNESLAGMVRSVYHLVDIRLVK